MGIIHRDIKSENILIDSRENIRIVDFGLSYIESSGMPLRQGMDYAIEFLGTPPYMAPEILRNKDMPPRRRRRYGKAVDWWALGCILFELESETHQVNCMECQSPASCLIKPTMLCRYFSMSNKIRMHILLGLRGHPSLNKRIQDLKASILSL